jgi:hypothetical protein
MGRSYYEMYKNSKYCEPYQRPYLFEMLFKTFNFNLLKSGRIEFFMRVFFCGSICNTT